MVKLGIRRLAVINQSGEIVGVLSFDNLVDGSRWKCPISRASSAKSARAKAP
jgi:hypothetical protein